MTKYPTAFDVENTVTITEYRNEKGDKKIHKDYGPYNAANYLVSVGISQFRDGKWQESGYFILDHKDLSLEERGKKSEKMAAIQALLDDASILVGHNIKYDLQWAWAAGFKTTSYVWDTMAAEYIMGRGDPKILYALSLDACTARYKTEQRKKGDLIDQYLADGVMFDEIPIDIVTEYGMADCVSCGQLYHKQLTALLHPDNATLKKSITLLNYFTHDLAEMERVGMKIQLDTLEEVRKEFLAEQQELLRRLYEIGETVMGDRPFSLTSPDDMSTIFYSRSPIDKRAWRERFIKKGVPINRRMNPTAFKTLLRTSCVREQKKSAHHCPVCNGTGKIWRIKKDNTRYKKPNNCGDCGGVGVQYKDTGETAGFKFMPKDAYWISFAGFSTDKENLEYLAGIARAASNFLAEEFCQKKMRLNKVNIYLQTFCDGIKRAIKDDGLLHASFNQCLTKTTRLSSSDPNMQNQPRGKTFPIKTAFVSRWVGGKVLDVDFSQLEFRVAVAMARCATGLATILAGEDVHKLTYTTLTEAGQPTDRQEAKPHTFKPLYGGVFGTPAEMEYYKRFLEKYFGIDDWQKEIQDEAIKTKKVRTPTGKEYAFPYAKRNYFGGASGSTRIKNYPVQGTATGDIVPWGFVLVSRALKGYKSIVINTVHDSILVDVHPDELGTVPKICLEVLLMCERWIKLYYDWDLFNVPIDAEAQIGDTWGSVEDIRWDDMDDQEDLMRSFEVDVKLYEEVAYEQGNDI